LQTALLRCKFGVEAYFVRIFLILNSQLFRLIGSCGEL
jgi:hypothetical protein